MKFEMDDKTRAITIELPIEVLDDQWHSAAISFNSFQIQEELSPDFTTEYPVTSLSFSFKIKEM